MAEQLYKDGWQRQGLYTRNLGTSNHKLLAERREGYRLLDETEK